MEQLDGALTAVGGGGEPSEDLVRTVPGIGQGGFESETGAHQDERECETRDELARTCQT